MSGPDTAVLESSAVAKKKVRREPETPKTLFAVKGTPTWFAWLKDYADHRGMAVTVLLDFALHEQARRDGVELPPKRIP